MSEEVVDEPSEPEADQGGVLRSDAWTDLGLTLPIFVAYHVCVIFLPIRNAADVLTVQLRELAQNSIASYIGLTLLIGAIFVGVLVALGRGKALSGKRFLVVAIEGLLYAAVLRIAASQLLEALPLSQVSAPPAVAESSPEFTGVVMSLGAGFYEEVAFRVVLFGSGAWLIRTFFDRTPTAFVLKLLWALASGMLFSLWHYVGPYSDAFELRSFAYRAICGFILAIVYMLRGFAPAVFTHALYDVWAMVL